MIIPENNKQAAAIMKLAESRSGEAAKDEQGASEDLPPNYSDVGNPTLASESNSTASSPRPTVPNIKPCNFVALSRSNESVKGPWLVDPGMYIPSSMLPPLEEGQTEDSRPNLSLKSHNGSLDVDIYVVQNGSTAIMDATNEQGKQGGKPRRVIIHASSKNGSVTSRIREVAPASNGTTSKRFPLNISHESYNGRITVYLPRTFEGPIRAKTYNGSVKYSASVEEALTRFSDVDGVQRSFIGRFEPSTWVQDPGSSWEGDELSLESKNGSINVYYEDDLKLSSKPKTGFFSRLFG